jgi:hypothetical protein
MKLINLKTNKLGQNFKYYEKIDSTQSEIWRLVDSNKIADGMLVMSNIQTNGQELMAEYGTQTKLKILPFLSM